MAKIDERNSWQEIFVAHDENCKRYGEIDERPLSIEERIELGARLAWHAHEVMHVMLQKLAIEQDADRAAPASGEG